MPLQLLCTSHIGEVYKKRDRVYKYSDKHQHLRTEKMMLEFLQTHSNLPVAPVESYTPGCLELRFIEHDNSSADEDAAYHLARLHSVDHGYFGFACDTTIGPFAQPNRKCGDWTAFYREQRLEYMAGICFELGVLERSIVRQIEKLDLAPYLDEPSPSLIHGDIWGGNVLTRHGKIAAFIDPAIYFAHREVELAFITMFHTFSQRFFRAYDAINPIEEGFWEIRKDIYLLYPLLVHQAIYKGGYESGIKRILRRL